MVDPQELWRRTSLPCPIPRKASIFLFAALPGVLTDWPGIRYTVPWGGDEGILALGAPVLPAVARGTDTAPGVTVLPSRGPRTPLGVLADGLGMRFTVPWGGD